MITQFKKHLEPLLHIIAQPVLSINPHILTLVSVIFAFLFAFLLSWNMYLLAAISWIGVIFDALDGYVARKKEKVTKFGAFFDSTMDRISDFFYISAFGFAGFIPWYIVSIALITTFLISYTKARGESLMDGKIISDGWMQRTERLIILFVVFLLYVLDYNNLGLGLFILFIGLNIVTCLQRIYSIKKLL